jgi:hypothetical protein
MLVNSVEKKTTQNGKVYYTVMIDGQQCSCWFDDIKDFVNQNITATIVEKQKGDKVFKNLKEFVDSSGKIHKQPYTPRGGGSTSSNGNGEKNRGVALSYAKDLEVAYISKGGEYTKIRMYDNAEAMLAWIEDRVSSSFESPAN